MTVNHETLGQYSVHRNVYEVCWEMSFSSPTDETKERGVEEPNVEKI